MTDDFFPVLQSLVFLLRRGQALSSQSGWGWTSGFGSSLELKPSTKDSKYVVSYSIQRLYEHYMNTLYIFLVITVKPLWNDLYFIKHFINEGDLTITRTQIWNKTNDNNPTLSVTLPHTCWKHWSSKSPELLQCTIGLSSIYVVTSALTSGVELDPGLGTG